MVLAVRILGFIIATLGFLFTITILGAVIGIPMMIVGTIMVLGTFLFGSRKTTITNVINVAGAPYQGAAPQPPYPAQAVGAMDTARPPIEHQRQVAQPLLAAKFCGNCGAAITDAESAFCGQCGNKLYA